MVKRENTDFLKSQFPLALLALFVLLFAVMSIHASHWKESELFAFAVDSAKLFEGALLGILTQRLLEHRKSDVEETRPSSERHFEKGG